MIRVLVVDDHRLLREGLRLLVDRARGMSCVGEAATAEQALEICDNAQADVVLMDIEMPGMGGLAGTQEILRRHPRARVIVISLHDDGRLIRRAFGSGAKGYLPKSAADTELVDAIRAVVAGERYLHPSLPAALSDPLGGVDR